MVFNKGDIVLKQREKENDCHFPEWYYYSIAR